ncbi:hypothetical protein Tco_0949106, partial [Tanacetum coccineum]
MLRESSDFYEESVEKSWGKESANESGSKFIPRFDSSFVEFIQPCFLLLQLVIGETSLGGQLHFRNSNCGTGSQSDNTVSSPHGFIIHGIKIFKDNEKVTKVVDVENWRVDNSRVLRWVVSLIEWNSSVSSMKSSIQSTFSF